MFVLSFKLGCWLFQLLFNRAYLPSDYLRWLYLLPLWLCFHNSQRSWESIKLLFLLGLLRIWRPDRIVLEGMTSNCERL